MEGTRIDKWLWAARFFKTRSIASRACELGRIETNGQPVKASREVRAGDVFRIKTEGGDFTVEVLVVAGMRVGAAVAQTYYKETEESREARLKVAEERKAMFQADGFREARPNKRQRREIDRFRRRA